MKLTPMIAFAILAASGSAYAQGGGGLSPQVHAARDAVMKACTSEAHSLCDGKEKREMMICLRDNAAKLSAPCADAMSKMPPRPQRPQ
ncbi:MAG TPA: hypothetical protein VFE10_08705 [Phenylobacterium sp.]|nr:hypothetical protein [Phenylobacterium sp.]